MIVFVVVVAVLAGLVVFIAVREGNKANEIREAQIAACEGAGSLTRTTLIQILQEQIDESHSPLTEKVEKALHLTPEEAEVIINAQNKKRQNKIDQLESVNCVKQYE